MVDQPTHRARIEPDWYEAAFGDLYNVIYAHRTVEAAAPEAAFAAHALEMRADDCLLDLCCGCGRHLFHLIKTAPRAVGLDFSRELLTQGRALLGDAALLVRGDMRALPFRARFDCLTNFFTSFGYFHAGEENAAVARGMREALKPGGRFLVDHANAADVRTALIPQSTRRQGEYEIVEERWVDEAAQRVNKVMRIAREGRAVREIHESVRLYGPDELRMLLMDAGLAVTDFYGDWSGASFTKSSPRMIVRGVVA
ncbi:MAG: class I SAM-dependent methyltransferase [Candidatus Hydrogenedentes bacterium]|nr:class I SAM-dependent methyltransferase [Candidatus Hydrogenedentota bacterium]